MKITIIGSGDAFGSGGRCNTCFRIETSGRDLLLDCGASSLPALKAQGVDPNAIDGVMLSHLHGDHFGGVVFLVMDGHFLSRRTRPLLIAGPPGTRERLDALSTDPCLARATLVEEKLSAQQQALRHHPRPVARHRQDLRLLQDE